MAFVHQCQESKTFLEFREDFQRRVQSTYLICKHPVAITSEGVNYKLLISYDEFSKVQRPISRHSSKNVILLQVLNIFGIIFDRLSFKLDFLEAIDFHPSKRSINGKIWGKFGWILQIKQFTVKFNCIYSAILHEPKTKKTLLRGLIEVYSCQSMNKNKMKHRKVEFYRQKYNNNINNVANKNVQPFITKKKVTSAVF